MRVVWRLFIAWLVAKRVSNLEMVAFSILMNAIFIGRFWTGLLIYGLTIVLSDILRRIYKVKPQ